MEITTSSCGKTEMNKEEGTPRERQREREMGIPPIYVKLLNAFFYIYLLILEYNISPP